MRYTESLLTLPQNKLNKSKGFFRLLGRSRLQQRGYCINLTWYFILVFSFYRRWDEFDQRVDKQWEIFDEWAEKQRADYSFFRKNEQADAIIPQNDLHEGVQYSLSEKSNAKNLANIDFYREKEYNSYGWARVNGVLSSKENADFRSKFARAVLGKTRPDTSNGEYIIACGEDGVNNKLVYAKGNKNDLQDLTITKVVEIKLDSETDIEVIRNYIRGEEHNGNSSASIAAQNYFGEALVGFYTNHDFSDYQDIKRESRSRTSGENSTGNPGTNRSNKNGRRTSYIFEEEVSDDDVKFGDSLSQKKATPKGKYTGLAYEGEDIAPVAKTTEAPTKVETPTSTERETNSSLSRIWKGTSRDEENS